MVRLMPVNRVIARRDALCHHLKGLMVNPLHMLDSCLSVERAEQQLTNCATAKLGENKLAIDDATGRAAADIYIARPQIERLGIVADATISTSGKVQSSRRFAAERVEC